MVEPFSVPLRLLEAAVLAAIAVRGLLTLPPAHGSTAGQPVDDSTARKPPAAGRGSPDESGAPAGAPIPRDGVPRPADRMLATYLRFIGLTLLNPLTIVYFAALVLGLPALESGPVALAAFAFGPLVASLSWQLLIAGFGPILHHRMPVGARRVTSIVGSVVVLLLALRILVEAAGAI